MRGSMTILPLISVILALLSSYLVSSAPFSGFYEPVPGKGVNGSGSEDFGAAWLVSRERLLSAEQKIKETWSMAAVSFAVVRNKCPDCVTLLTRDYFDYMVEHLSSTSNRIPYGNRMVYNITGQRLKHTARKLQSMALSKRPEPRAFETLAVLVYSPFAFSMFTTPEQTAIRLNYFEVTFWSVFRYFPRVDIFVATKEDADVVDSLGLSYRTLTIVPTPLDKNSRTTSLMRLSLEMIMTGLKTADPRWDWMKYMYFTEGDQVLHMRGMSHVYDAIDSSQGTFAMVPHRMNTFPLKTTFPESLRPLWNDPKNGQDHLPRNLEIVVEDLRQVGGSCCDAGRNVYEPCPGWWYNCPSWGLANFTQWFRVGKTGLTFLPSTEHKGVCSYSATRQLCPVPAGCTERVPTKDYRMLTDRQGREVRSATRTYDACKQIPVVNYIVNYTAQMEREKEAQMSLRVQGLKKEIQLA